ncbi:hypothetical protein SE16_05690 [Ardenticatena maritima]|uniref:Uncharacterized protein n=1 Tax=Ardenticatena maritima TaxID=872965 RepID=A0A0P6YTB0_9CHLR|nr:hypothetical protein SE16_05690 [Ardenticatena maritima]
MPRQNWSSRRAPHTFRHAPRRPCAPRLNHQPPSRYATAPPAPATAEPAPFPKAPFPAPAAPQRQCRWG